MSIYMPEFNAVFLLVPKTASGWVSAVLEKLTKCERIAHGHDTLSTVKKYNPELWKTKPSVIAVVRNPVSWYDSCHRFYYGGSKEYPPGSWNPNVEGHPLQPLVGCFDPNIDKFIDNCVRTHPGFLTGMYKKYILDGTSFFFFIDYIIVYERMIHDMLDVFGWMGMERERAATAICSTPPVNVTYSNYIKMSKQSEDKILESEQEIVKLFWRKGEL